MNALERLQLVVVEHVKRFAFREDFGEVQWTPMSDARPSPLTAALTAARALQSWRRRLRPQAR
jgi:hypothetical protein